MPTYEYACRSCGEHIEVVQSFSDDPLTSCDSCGGELRKVFSAAGLIFKGSGWHIKDYSSGSGSGSGSRASSAPKSDDASSAGPSSTSSTPSPSSGGTAASTTD